MSKTISRRRAALKLHDKGLPVVLCHPKSKKAVHSGWQERRTTRELLEAELTNRPALNIAIELSQSPFIDVECDTPEAETSLLKMFGGKIPRTPTWQSARGKHRLFRRPTGLPDKAKVEIDGVEFRLGNGKGALSIVPPSVHETGATYRWRPGHSLDDIEPAELPPAVTKRLRKSKMKASSQVGSDRIPEGERNETLFRKACSMRDLGLPEATILLTMQDLNSRCCDPTLSDDEVAAIVRSAVNSESSGDDLVAGLLAEFDLWHDQHDEPYATVPQDEHRENWRIDARSKPFRRFIAKRVYERTGQVPKSQFLAELMTLLEGRAVYDGARFDVSRRIAGHAGNIYVDLVDEKWRAVEIDATGWRIVDESPVKFRRAKAMHALPVPAPAPSPKSLRSLLLPFLNVRAEQWPLVAVWLLAAFRPMGPYPILKLLGEQGSSKTTVARVLRALVDPNAAPVRSEPRDTRDLMIAANNGWIICADNLSVVKPDLSDALCRLATGGGFSTRTLYTDEDETIFDAQRPVILTSIDEIGTRSDLLERSLIIELPSIPEESRRPEKAFWAEFEQARPFILGALFDTVSSALRKLPEIEARQGQDLPRMADFHQWGQAAEECLRLAPGTFAEAYRANQEAATKIALESSPAVTALLKLLGKKPLLENTASSLLERLGNVNADLRKQPGWPKSPRVLSSILKRVAPNLRQIGVVAVQDTRGGGATKEKIWRIVREN